MHGGEGQDDCHARLVVVLVLRRSSSALRPRSWHFDLHCSQLLTRQLHTSFEHLVKRQRVTVPLKPKRETELRCVSVFENQHNEACQQ